MPQSEFQMMSCFDRGFDVVRYNNFNIIRFKMDSAQYGIDIVFPHPGVSVDKILPHLEGKAIADWKEKAIRVSWDIIKMPKWEIETALFFKISLERMGLDHFFNGKGCFSGITPSNIFMISNIYQKAKFIVDEKGAEAAAATIDIAIGSADFERPKREPTKLILDRPFVYMLTDISTGTIIFIGEIRSFQNMK